MTSEAADLSQPAAGDAQSNNTSIPRRKPVPAGPPPLTSESITSPPTIASAEPQAAQQSAQSSYQAAGQTNTKEKKEPDVEYAAVKHGNRNAFSKFAFSVSLTALDKIRLGPLEKYLPYDKTRRRYIIAGAIAGIIALLALIIGLAAGLTAGKGKTQNLPLPTSNGGPYTGDMTYYGPALGACGITSSSSDSICAVSHIVFDAAQKGSNPNANPLCGLKIRLRRDQKSVDVTVVDRCVGCKATDIDTTTSVFAKLADIDQGRVVIDWAWLESEPVNVTAS